MGDALSYMKIITCPICGKTFLYNSQSVYKLPNRESGMIYYCSYTCFRKEEKERERKKRNPYST